MEIKNTTKFSKEGYFTLNKAMLRRSYFVCVLLEIALAALMVYIIIKDNNDIVKPIFLGILMITYPFILGFVLSGQMKRNYNMNKAVYENMIYDYEFTDEKLKVRLTQNNQCNEGYVTYKAMYKVIDTEKFLFVFISSNQAYIIEKSCFASNEDIDKVISKIKEENVKYKFLKIKFSGR